MPAFDRDSGQIPQRRAWSLAASSSQGRGQKRALLRPGLRPQRIRLQARSRRLHRRLASASIKRKIERSGTRNTVRCVRCAGSRRTVPIAFDGRPLMTLLNTLRLAPLALGLALASTAHAAAPELDVKGGSPVLRIGDQAPAYTVKVGYPDGRISQTELLAGESLAIAPDAGKALADGYYRIEMTPILGVTQRGDAANLLSADQEKSRPQGNTISTGFRVANGQLISAEAKEPMLAQAGKSDQDNGLMKDQVIIDDLIVDGSACIGTDCANGENFGFDTLRLKENNTRIKFDDTSNSGSFPFVDWQLTANESDNGGLNKFSIDDVTNAKIPFTIEANARSNSLYVKNSGRIGIGTNLPAVQVHQKDGNTPTYRLEQDGSSGFSAQTWDVAGNETNFFIRDVTNGSKLPFKIIPNAPNNALYVAASGNVGLSTASPASLLHLRGAGSVLPRITLENADATGDNWLFDVSDNHDFRISVNGTGVQEFLLDDAGNLTITGTLTTAMGNTCAAGCDRVFSEDYALEGIDEHASMMWQNRYLPAVGPTDENARSINITAKIGGMLNELEKAHIYIEQLHRRLNELEAKLNDK
ncbi:hypothetical protein [Pseudomarimonas arenosa]|uniref:Uncharacterized protein n=1 Tax=Pseudomarimonas arenosa TaxID=2774145 RepID=A0AAW3ZIW0_9GAMM|nr:hypothetical protein [Pseudomarimonas arenosa]MBD8524875.1 hypothetical protein [Pseudomarimonas arenosa]